MAATNPYDPYAYNPYYQTATTFAGAGQTPYAPPAVQAPNINQQNAALGRLGGYRPATSGPPVSSPVGVGAQQAQPMQVQPIPVDWSMAGYGPTSYQPANVYGEAPPAAPLRSWSGKPATSPWEQRHVQYQQSLLGPDLASIVLPGGGSRPLTYQDIPFIETRLAYETQQQAEQDLQRARDELVRSWYGVGASPESMMAKQAATQFLQQGGPYTPTLMDMLRGQMRNQAGVTQQSLQRQAAEDYARRGISGGLTSYEQAMLAQQGAMGLQGQLTGLEQQAALANLEARRQALADLTQIAQFEQTQRQTIDQLLAQLIPEREAPSLAQLLEPSARGGTTVGF